MGGCCPRLEDLRSFIHSYLSQSHRTSSITVRSLSYSALWHKGEAKKSVVRLRAREGKWKLE
jgi:hypothetical protein